MHLVDNIKTIRKLLGQSQEEFARRFTGITLGMQKSYEAGRASPGVLYLKELSNLVKIPVEQLKNEAFYPAGQIGGKKDNAEESIQGSVMEVLKMMAAAFKEQADALRLQAEIMKNIEQNMARQVTQGQIDEKVRTMDARTKEMDANLTRVLVGVETLSKDQEQELKEIRHLFSAIEAQKANPSRGVGKKSRRSNGDVEKRDNPPAGRR